MQLGGWERSYETFGFPATVLVGRFSTLHAARYGISSLLRQGRSKKPVRCFITIEKSPGCFEACGKHLVSKSFNKYIPLIGIAPGGSRLLSPLLAILLNTFMIANCPTSIVTTSANKGRVTSSRGQRVRYRGVVWRTEDLNRRGRSAGAARGVEIPRRLFLAKATSDPILTNKDWSLAHELLAPLRQPPFSPRGSPTHAALFFSLFRDRNLDNKQSRPPVKHSSHDYCVSEKRGVISTGLTQSLVSLWVVPTDPRLYGALKTVYGVDVALVKRGAVCPLPPPHRPSRRFGTTARFDRALRIANQPAPC